MAERMISHYRVVRRLGAGGMGEVLLAEDTRLERSVAIKIMSAELAKDPNHRKRFHTEAKAASGLNHPNICVIYEVGETADGCPYLAMEFIEGQTLDDLMRQRRLPVRDVLSLGIQIAGALDAAHARRIVHRDIKPANIMLDRRGAAKVLDFGLAKRVAPDGLGDKTSLHSSLTHAGTLIGTPHYMSPEQVLGRELDHRSDLFSLGTVLHELISGQKPFLGKTVGETINNVVNQPSGPLGLENPRFTPALDRIIARCLEKKPENRYGSAKDLAADLTQLRHDSEREASPNVRPNGAVATAVQNAGQPAERTKLWQLSHRPKPEANHRAALLAGFVIFFAAAACAFYFVDSFAWRVAISIAEILILSFAGYWWLSSLRRPSISSHDQTAEPPKIQSNSLAVLPFANFSAEKDSDYLSDGLTEEITSALSRLPGLKVAARNSAFAFKGRNEDARKIGEALRVTMLLEGSVRKSGRQIRVNAQLINVADGYHIWSENFDRDVDNFIAVQEEIARRIAERLRMEIGAETNAAMVQRRAVNPEAHVMYLRARHAWNKRTRADIEQAVQWLRKAIDIDPAYADAHAGLAAAYVILPSYAYRPAAEYLPLARSAATRALELDPTSAEAHAVLGDAATQMGDFETSITHHRRAIELNPNYATGHQWYGAALFELGRIEEALSEYRKAEELDPLSPIIRSCIPELLFQSGRNDEAIVESKKAIELFPDFPTMRKFSAQALMRKGLYREALAELNSVRASSPGSPARLDLVAFCEARLGNEAEARRILAELEEWRSRGHDVDEEVGRAHVGLRELDKAVNAFERFVESGTLCRSGLNNPILLDELGDHPRYRALLRKVEPKPQQLGEKANHQAKPALVAGAIVLTVCLLALGSGIYLVPKSGLKSRPANKEVVSASMSALTRSVAVLPFDNSSAEKDTDYLSDGLTDEITTALSRVPGLKVVARNSAFTFKGRKTDLRKVGAALGAATLLDGSFHKSGQQVRVTAQLIDAASGFPLWSKSYDRSLPDIMSVQVDIALQIAERLHGDSAPARPQAVAPEAHKLYLQGRVFWNKRTVGGLRKAIDFFQQAIEQDPTYAAAHAALASCYYLLPQYSEGLRPSQYRPLVRASANRALELDPACAEAHAVLAMLLNFERDHVGAAEHLRLALQSEPNYATAHHWYGLCLGIAGRRQEGLAELQKALDLDPLSPIIHTTIPEWYYQNRDYDRAIIEARKVIETFPDFPTARVNLVLPLILKGQLHEALEEIEKARELQPDQPLALLNLKGFCLARLGRETEARKILADLDQVRQQGKSVEGSMLLIYQGLREYDKECELADQIRISEGISEEILIDPLIDEIRDLPQFQAFLERAGLTQGGRPINTP